LERIAVVGRGGTGKTSFVALLTLHFIEKGETPVLLVDLDSDMNLAEMVGPSICSIQSLIIVLARERWRANYKNHAELRGECWRNQQ
jgi:CO dehydrogenase nickel-insertion accessory protein CooC1